MPRRKGECITDYYDRLALGDKAFDARQAAIEQDVVRQIQDQERVSKKTFGMGVNE